MDQGLHEQDYNDDNLEGQDTLVPAENEAVEQVADQPEGDRDEVTWGEADAVEQPESIESEPDEAAEENADFPEESAAESDESAEPQAEESSEEEAFENAESEAESGEQPEAEEETTEGEGEEGSTEIGREQIVEALLFSSDGPLPAAKIAKVLGAISSREIRDLIDTLNAKYRRLNSSFQIEEIAGGYQMMTRPEYADYLQQLFKIRSESKLSAAALETLAVIAYKQPVLRAEVEAIRGVSCGEMIRTLMEKDLIKIVGRAEELGRPMLYGTTRRFLELFGLGTLEDLPKVPELLPPSGERGQARPEGEDAAEGAEEEPREEVKPEPAAEAADQMVENAPTDEPAPPAEDAAEETPADEQSLPDDE